MTDATKDCPYCAETIKAAAKVCRFCGMNLGTGKPITETMTPRTVKAKSGVADGVKLGCGMFIVLPLLILLVTAVIFGLILASAGGMKGPRISVLGGCPCVQAMADYRRLRWLDWTDTRSLVASFLGMRLDPLAGRPLGLGDGVLVSPPTSYPHRIARAEPTRTPWSGAPTGTCAKNMPITVPPTKQPSRSHTGTQENGQ